MRAVIQRVSSASVTIESKIYSKIDQGILILIGIEETDAFDDIEWLVKKLSTLRIFNDAKDKMNLSIQDVNGSFLVISQFTLFASIKKGNRPSYIRASKPNKAIPIYEEFVRQLQISSLNPVKTGIFGADMKVNLFNDGPVTIIIDTKNKE